MILSKTIKNLELQEDYSCKISSKHSMINKILTKEKEMRSMTYNKVRNHMNQIHGV